MPTYAFMNIFQGESGMPEDRFVNTWHFFGSTGTVTDFDNVRDMLKDFYDKEWSGGERLTLRARPAEAASPGLRIGMDLDRLGIRIAMPVRGLALHEL